MDIKNAGLAIGFVILLAHITGTATSNTTTSSDLTGPTQASDPSSVTTQSVRPTEPSITTTTTAAATNDSAGGESVVTTSTSAPPVTTSAPSSVTEITTQSTTTAADDVGTTPGTQNDAVVEVTTEKETTSAPSTTTQLTTTESDYEKPTEKPTKLMDDKRKGPQANPPLLSVTRSIDETGVMKFLFLEDDKPCLKAKFKLSLLVTYPSTGRDKNTKTNLTATLQPPRDVIIGGRCGLANYTHPRIDLEWGGGNYRFVIKFSTALVSKQKSEFDSAEESKPSLEPVSQAHSISFTYNLGDTNVFLHPVAGGILTATSDRRGSFFQAPLGDSYRCSSPALFPLYLPGQTNATVTLRMSDARIQTFRMKSSGKFGDEVVCDADRISPSKNIIPIAVAGCLTVVILIVVLAYFITKRTRRSGYGTVPE